MHTDEAPRATAMHIARLIIAHRLAGDTPSGQVERLQIEGWLKAAVASRDDGLLIARAVDSVVQRARVIGIILFLGLMPPLLSLFWP